MSTGRWARGEPGYRKVWPSPVRRDGRRHRVALDQVQRVEALAQLPGLRVPEPHLVADEQVVRGGAEQRRLHLAGALLGVVAQTLRQVGDRQPVGAQGRPRPGKPPPSTMTTPTPGLRTTGCAKSAAGRPLNDV